MSNKGARRRSSAVPLTIVPVLAALVTSCSSNRRPTDPCDNRSFNDTACERAVSSGGYYHGGVFYPRVYPYSAGYYRDAHSRYLSTRAARTTARTNVTRGGFGGIGGSRGFSGS
jgi:hypothetical protein